MKVLLGVDTSAHSRETVSTVCRMPWPAGTSVVVLSVVAPSEPQYAPPPHVLAAVAGDLSVIEAAHLKAHEDLVTETEDELRRAGLDAAGRIVDGDPRHVLVETARTEGIDLMVVGSHGHSGLGRVLMGCVASYVVGHAPCDVMVVRREDRRSAS
ncbi:MAG: universal stress protein [Candidatus Eisenbacteria bacterium]